MNEYQLKKLNENIDLDWSRLAAIACPDKWIDMYRHYQDVIDGILYEDRERLIDKIIIEDYSEYIKLSNKVRIKPYIQGKCRIPKKYQSDTYGFDTKGRLVNLETDEILIANSKTYGKPKLKKVNGQEIYNQFVTKFARNNLIRGLHTYFEHYFKALKLIDKNNFPIELEIIFNIHDEGKSNIDNDNKWIWRKAAQDTLVEMKKIPDDNPYIIKANREVTNLISEDQVQSMIINLYKLK